LSDLTNGHLLASIRLPRGQLIAFSGVDGSGKSTQVKLLQERFRGLHKNTKRVWCRWRPITSLPLLTILRRLGYAEVHPTSSIGFVETRIPRNGGLAFLWSTLTQIDNFVKTGTMVVIPLMLGRTVICDRYVLDLMVEGMADLKDQPGRTRLGYKLLRFLPRPQQAFLVRVDPSVAFERKPDMPTLSHFRARAELYNELAHDFGVVVLDGTLSPEAIHDEIWRRIGGDGMA
jgi:thymidylate kinase